MNVKWMVANAKGRRWEEAGLRLAETDRGIAWQVIDSTRSGYVGYAADGSVSDLADYGPDLSEDKQAAIERACEALDIEGWG